MRATGKIKAVAYRVKLDLTDSYLRKIARMSSHAGEVLNVTILRVKMTRKQLQNYKTS